MKNLNRHLFHLVDNSPWPFFISLHLLNVVISFVMTINRLKFSFFFFIVSFLILIIFMYSWWKDIIEESSNKGYHTLIVKRGLKLGFILFLVSEIMFFFGFFWAFFHSGLSPSVTQGFTWPPLGISVLNPLSIPLLNTLILLISSITITWLHYLFLNKNNLYFNSIIDFIWNLINDNLFFIKNVYNNKNKSIFKKFNFYRFYLKYEFNVLEAFLITLLLSNSFILLQYYEYLYSPLNIMDSVFGSIFFSLTGLHGFHVLIGTIFIYICFLRFLKNQFTNKISLGLEFSIWYWHFVDVVWLFLYIFVYWWIYI